jgi:glycine hydroxymethyltransferase
MGYNVLTGGTDNHMFLINVSSLRDGLTGVAAQKCLEECGIIVDMNKLPYDKRCDTVTSGIRLGTPIVTKNGMGTEEMDRISGLTDAILKRVKIINDTECKIDESFRNESRDKVKKLCRKFPLR